ncbi:MAG: hypothetical protein WBE22_03845 [Halobacteriota archaeon]
MKISLMNCSFFHTTPQGLQKQLFAFLRIKNLSSMYSRERNNIGEQLHGR